MRDEREFERDLCHGGVHLIQLLLVPIQDILPSKPEVWHIHNLEFLHVVFIKVFDFVLIGECKGRFWLLTLGLHRRPLFDRQGSEIGKDVRTILDHFALLGTLAAHRLAEVRVFNLTPVRKGLHFRV
jgi:hypothetical protein